MSPLSKVHRTRTPSTHLENGTSGKHLEHMGCNAAYVSHTFLTHMTSRTCLGGDCCLDLSEVKQAAILWALCLCKQLLVLHIPCGGGQATARRA